MTHSDNPAEPIAATEDMHVLLERFAVHLAARNYSPYTIEQRTITGTAFIAWARCAGVCRAQDVSRDLIERYRIHLFNHRKANGEPLSVLTQRVRLVALRLLPMAGARGDHCDRSKCEPRSAA